MWLIELSDIPRSPLQRLRQSMHDYDDIEANVDAKTIKPNESMEQLNLLKGLSPENI